MKLANSFDVTGDYNAKGTASYAYSPARKIVSFSLNASAYGYPISQNGEYPLDPSVALSKNVKVGEKLNFGPLALDVLSIQNGIAECAMTMDQDSGKAQFDVTGEYIVLKGVQATVKVSVGWFGISANVQLVEV